MLAAVTCTALAMLPTGKNVDRTADATAAPVGQGFTLNASDIRFIRDQIRIAERHVTTLSVSNPCGTLVGTAPNQVGDPSLPFGLRTVDGTCNNLQPGQDKFGAADELFPRMLTPLFRQAEDSNVPGIGPVGPPGLTSYTQTSGLVVDSQPRTVSNLVVDQTPDNPAAVAAAGPGAIPDATNTLFIPNVAPDVGLSAPYNSWFTLFGQFFDHGLDLVTKGGNGSVFMPLKEDDPLFVPGSPTNFMTLSRATMFNGHESRNTTTPFVDQNQTYTSHPSHQVFLREYANNLAGDPETTGRLIDGAIEGNIGNWAEIKAQAATLLGIQLEDIDVLNVPLLATDPYGHFIPGPNGLPQVVFPGNVLTEGNTTTPISVVGSMKTQHAFLDDIAHNAVPSATKTPDGDSDVSTAADLQPAGTYDDELLDLHFVTGDGRGNENIGLTAVHSVFHAEHNRLRDDIDNIITTQLTPAEIADWQAPAAAAPAGSGWTYNERLFQAARFVTEMQYQHLVFEEFGRKVQPQINVFAGYQTEINPAIVAEFAHTVYRFGHSMLTQTIDRTATSSADTAGATNIDLFEGFLNPVAFNDHDGNPATDPVSSSDATGVIVQAMSRQVGNELDEFVTDVLRNRLVGLPLDLPAINMARGRSEGIPGLNSARRQLFAGSGEPILAPYESWADFGMSIKHVESLANFIAAYGTHPLIMSLDPDSGGPITAGSLKARRAAADQIINGTTLPGPDGIAGDDPLTVDDESADDLLAPADSLDFVTGANAWANDGNGIPITGLEGVDFWVGGLAEKQAPFGGLLGSTFNWVFETQMENLQDGDRFYYLTRTAGLNILTQLEGNSFSELIMRNSSAEGLPAEVFARPDFVFNVPNLGLTGPIVDDPTTPEWDENLLLVRNNPTAGTIRFNGGEHVIWHGSDSATDIDRIHSSEGDDTLRLNGGNDRAEGGAGNDQFIGGEGNDILTDNFGDDVIKGGHGNDYISSGQGFDLNQGGLGKDFVVSGSDPTETFGGPGDDMIFAGHSADTVFGDDGDDWIEGGNQADLLQGDNGAPFQNDINAPGNDVISGDGGNDDYDSEGGDDIMVAGPGIERSEGMLGFDWVTHRGDPQAANDDMFFTGLLPPDLDNIRERFDNVEALSGWNFDDILRGTDADATVLGTEHLLNADGIARITGLADILPVGATSFNAGDILVGGNGSDRLEGRGGDDIIDGDRWLNVQLTDGTVSGDTMATFRSRVAAGTLDPGDITIVRSLLNPGAGSAVDTAEFRGALAEYVITQNGDGSTTVDHQGGIDGVDTLWNVEQLQFCDNLDVDGVCLAPDIVPITGVAPGTPALTVAPGATTVAAPLQFGNVAPGAAAAVQDITVTNSGTGGQLNVTGATLPLANQTPAGQFSILNNGCAGTPLGAGGSCVIQVGFAPTALPLLPLARTAQLSITTNATNATVFLRGVRAVVAALTTATIESPTDFGTRRIGEPRTRTVRVTNDGAVNNLTVTGVSTTGPFTATNVDCTNVAPGRTCRLSVTFNPTAPLGDKVGTVRISGNVTNAVLPGDLTGASRAAAVVVDALRIVQVPSPTSVKPVNVSLRVSTASTIRLQVRRTNGKLVWSKSLKAKKAGTNKLKWNLRDSKGRKVKKGKYVFTLTVTDASGAKVVVKKTVRVR